MEVLNVEAVLSKGQGLDLACSKRKRSMDIAMVMDMVELR